jgi:tRNA pseudouridine55 synthase
MSRKTAARQIDGLLVINKPSGITSMDVVRRVKHYSGIKKVGHGGTLDPIATGVIPVCLGQATRMMEYLVDGGKEYRGVVELGVHTDTYDSAGQVVTTTDASGVTAEQVEEALAGFRGTIDQVPPMYSALKKDGKRLYDLARAGIEVERDARRVVVETLTLEEYDPPFATVFVQCGRGFYMRSLAHDLGQALGVGGNLKSLIRLRSGHFRLEEALTLDAVEEIFTDGGWKDSVRAPDAALSHLPALVLGDRLVKIVRQGQPIPVGARVPSRGPGDQARAYTTGGEFVGLLKFDGATGQWEPEKVFEFAYIDPAYRKPSKTAKSTGSKS